MTARRQLAAATIGDGVARAFRQARMPGHGVGRVVGTFSSGFYVSAGDTVFAVVGPTVAAGPIHLLLDALPPCPSEGSVVYLGPDRLWTDSSLIDMSHGSRFRPTQPTPVQLELAARTLADVDREDAIPIDVAHVWPAVRDAVERSDLHAAGELLQGLGGGLTPTGDDVLASLLLFARWADPLSVVPTEVAEHAATTDLSRCFLGWAAAGQSIQPVHDLVTAACQIAESAASGTGAAALPAHQRFARAFAEVAALGGSSGKAMLAGLGLAATAACMSTRGR